MAQLIIRCKRCRKEATLDPNALLEGQAVTMEDCPCHRLSELAALVQETALRAWDKAGANVAQAIC